MTMGRCCKGGWPATSAPQGRGRGAVEVRTLSEPERRLAPTPAAHITTLDSRCSFKPPKACAGAARPNASWFVAHDQRAAAPSRTPHQCAQRARTRKLYETEPPVWLGRIKNMPR